MTFVAVYAGVHLAGLIGVVIAVVALQTLETAIVVAAVGRRLGFAANDLHYLLPVVKTSIATIAASLAAFATKFPLSQAHTLVTMAACCVVFTLVYIPTAYLLGAVTDSEKEELRNSSIKFFLKMRMLLVW